MISLFKKLFVRRKKIAYTEDGYPFQADFFQIMNIIAVLKANGCHPEKNTVLSLIPKDTYKLMEVSLPNELQSRYDQRMIWPVVQEYASRQTPFPPLLANERGGIIDGFHRLYASIRRGDKTIRVYAPRGVEKVRFSGQINLLF